MKKSKAVLGSMLLFILICVAGFSTEAAVSATVNVSSSVSVNQVGVAVFNDLACTQPCTALVWGSVDKGADYTKTVYVKNTGTQSVTLAMAISNGNPADSGITQNWDSQGVTLAAGDVKTAILTLNVPAETTATTFSYTTTFTGTS